MGHELHDARHIYRVRDLDELRHRQNQILAGAGVERRPQAGTLVAYLNHGRWVADCTCGGGLGVWDAAPTATCLDCGRTWSIEWPHPNTRRAVEAALGLRSHREQLNWDPRRGETVQVLHEQNRDFGVE